MTCIKCQKCCRILTVPTRYMLDQKLVEFYRARGIKLKMADGFGLDAVIPYKCPHITKDGCDIYDRRPQVCRDFDGRKVPYLDCARKGE